MEIIRLQTPTAKSKIYIGANILDECLPPLTDGQKNFVVTDSNVYKLYKGTIEKYFKGAEIFVLKAGEKHKNLRSLYRLLSKMAGAGLHRTSKLFAFGGGVVGDIAGLAAALYMRGISYVQIPTTLLSQIDSSVGGKTAVDLRGVKNIVGAFYQPQKVIVDTAFLNTLPKKEIKCGVGELVKYAALDQEIFKLVQENLARLQDTAFLRFVVSPCINYKSGVVTRDEKETGERKSLNVGHTTGHAIELQKGLSHGESVLYGMLLETKIAIEKGVCERGYGEKLLSLIRAAIMSAPYKKCNLSKIGNAAKFAKADKKNKDDGKIRLSVAKDKGEWAELALDFDEYRTAIEKAAQELSL